MTKGKGLSRQEVREVYQTFGALMRRRCLLVLRDDALADDAVQNVFINLIRYGGSFRTANSPISWLYTACDRACWAIIDSRKRRTKREQSFEAPVSSPAVKQLEERNQVLRFMSELPPKLRQIAVMAYVDGFSQQEIGDALNWSRQTVHTKLKEIRAVATRLAGGEP